jgi:heme/copper-type cytochrome/quinol oxidase subunit 2
MKPTKMSVVLVIVFGVTVLSFLAVRLLVANGMAVPASPTNLLVTLAAIAVILLALTIPIWRYKASLTQYTKGPRPKRVDPFYAVRVVLLAKASAITGSGFVGWHLGAMIAQLSLPVSFTAALLQNSFGLVASVVLTVAAIVAEQICRLPDEPKDNQTDQMVSN